MLGAWSSGATSRTLQDASIYGRYEQWLTRYGRVYNNVNEKETRFKIFKENVAFIESSNKDANKPYKLSVNQFADLTNEEFKVSRNGFKGHECSTKTTSFKYENLTASLPATMDWRKKGAVTPVKDQGQCGSNDKALPQAIANQLVSDCIDAGGEDFMSYKSGVFKGVRGLAIDHCFSTMRSVMMQNFHGA
ncbi:unnamed protein product [Malus baccata var. baccata]